MEIENLKFRSVFKCFHKVFINLGKSDNRGNSDRFSEESKCLKKKKKRKENFLPLHFRIIFLRYVKDCKGVRSMYFN